MIRTVSLLLTIAALGLTGCVKKVAPTEPAPDTPPIPVTAGGLLKEYGTNAVAADARYKGKVLQVSGQFGSAQKAPLIGYVVQVFPDDGSDTVTYWLRRCSRLCSS